MELHCDILIGLFAQRLDGWMLIALGALCIAPLRKRTRRYN